MMQPEFGTLFDVRFGFSRGWADTSSTRSTTRNRPCCGGLRPKSFPPAFPEAHERQLILPQLSGKAGQPPGRRCVCRPAMEEGRNVGPPFPLSASAVGGGWSLVGSPYRAPPFPCRSACPGRSPVISFHFPLFMPFNI